MTGRGSYGLFLGVAMFFAVGAALGQGMQTFMNEPAAHGIARPTPLYGLTHQARIITLRATAGTVERSAVLTFAKLRPTKTACARGLVQNERSGRSPLHGAHSVRQQQGRLGRPSGIAMLARPPSDTPAR